jgi:hypothetical protein
MSFCATIASVARSVAVAADAPGKILPAINIFVRPAGCEAAERFGRLCFDGSRLR